MQLFLLEFVDLSVWRPWAGSLSSVLFQALGPYTHKTHNTLTKRTNAHETHYWRPLRFPFVNKVGVIKNLPSVL